MSDIQRNAPLLAAGLMLSGMMIIGLIDNYVVVIAEDASLWQFHAVRGAMAVPMMIGLAALGLGRLRAKRPRNVAIRSGLFGCAMLIYFGCLAFLPIAEVVAGLFSSPILVMVISALFLGKSVGWVRWTAGIVGFAGILLVLRPETGSFSLLSLLPLGAAFLYALSALATRQLCEGEDTLTLLFWFFGILGLMGCVGLIVMTAFPQAAPEGPDGFILRGLTWPSGTFLWWTFVQAFGSIIAIGFVTRSYQIGEASHVAVFEYSLMIFASFWAWMIRGEGLDMAAFVGISLIFVSGLVIALRSRGGA